MKNTTFVVVSTKGGTGKTIVASMVIPVLFAGTSKNITLYALDDNNTMKLKSAHITLKDLTTSDGEDVIDTAELKKITNSNDISIIDVGGGGDTRTFLKTVRASMVDGLTYIIPLGADIEQIHNLKETIKEIKKASKGSNIYLILNQVSVMNEDSIKSQFIGIYGSQKYGVPAISNVVLDAVDGVFFLETSPIFTILKNIYHYTLIDAYVSAQKLLTDVSTKKVEWAQKGEEYFKKQNTEVRLAKDVVKLTNRIHSMQAMVGK